MVIIGGRAHNLEEIAAVGALGYPFAEISLENPAIVQEQLEQLLALKEKHNLYYLAHYPNEGNPSDLVNLAKVFVPKVKKLIEFSPALGITKGTIHFWMDKRWASKNVIARKIEMLSDLVVHAAQYGVTLCLENLTSRQDSFCDFFKQIPKLQMTMDIGHGELLSKENTCFGFMQNAFDRIAHVHVHDNLGGTSVKDDLHLPLGEGTVDYPKIFAMLKEKGYHSTITMEVKSHAMNKTRDIILQHIQ